MPRPAGPVYTPAGAVTLDRSSPVPLYFQLAQHIEGEIRSGALNSGDRLDNEVKIAEDLKLSRPTVRAAFSYLVDRGLVLRRRGQGTIVTTRKVSRSVKLTSLFDDLSDAGKRPSTRVLHNEVIRASDLVKGALGLDDGQFVLYLERLRFGEGEPIALMHNFIPTSLVTLSSEMLEGHGLYELLRASGVFPARATQRISAKNASAGEARLLEEPRGTALVTMERTTYDDRGRAIEFAHHVYRASRYSLFSTVTADDLGRVGPL
ncbi:MAG TPA: GntR family transcriptional regulator [Acidimicrobiales bacterium]|nr:GntR family transcriptional regulator [Acidimicrobiales bacterium]